MSNKTKQEAKTYDQQDSGKAESRRQGAVDLIERTVSDLIQRIHAGPGSLSERVGRASRAGHITPEQVRAIEEAVTGAVATYVEKVGRSPDEAPRAFTFTRQA